MVRYSSLLMMFLLCVASSNATKVVDVDTICRLTINPPFCSTLLNSKPGGAKGADLISLAQYTVDVLHANLTNSVNLIKTQITKSGNDVNAREHYNRCLSHFVSNGGVLSMFGDVKRLFKKGNYSSMALAAVDIMLEFGLCTHDPDYQDTTSLLPKYFDVVQVVVEVIAIIAHYMG